MNLANMCRIGQGTTVLRKVLFETQPLGLGLKINVVEHMNLDVNNPNDLLCPSIIFLENLFKDYCRLHVM
jgi:hypothetical protein